jgi:aspartokinase-like uncharacterized kinase
MWIVKLGGSLFDSDKLKDCLRVLAESRPLVIVPGGGPFAEQVRRAQRQWGFDDSSAHVMAMLAMEQYGRMLCSLQPGLVAATTPSEIAAAHERGAIPVWMPTAMATADPQIEQSWDVTSDSLAAWLAHALEVKKLLLVKSLSFEDECLCAEVLVEQQVIDTRFNDYLRQGSFQAWVMGCENTDRIAEVLQGKLELATRINTGAPQDCRANSVGQQWPASH